MGRKQAVTYQDIAEYTGFSKATISRYFNDRDSLTLEKQDTISEALKKLDYRQNKVARVLANGKTEMVGILLPDLYHHFYYQILNKILGTYREFGFKFLVFNGDHNEEVERRYLQELMAYKVEGMIVLSNTLSSEELAAKIDSLGLSGKSNITFLIGGAFGLSSEVRSAADMLLSFSKMTFTHQMVRLLLVEQIYRAFKINRGEKYHW